jgi:hypothetical protein
MATLGDLRLHMHYSAVLLDQFGVLHDGRQAYPGAVQAVRELRLKGLRLLVISNSSRRAAGALGNLARLGFDPEDFCGVVTSGEVGKGCGPQAPWQRLRRPRAPPSARTPFPHRSGSPAMPRVPRPLYYHTCVGAGALGMLW